MEHCFNLLTNHLEPLQELAHPETETHNFMMDSICLTFLKMLIFFVTICNCNYLVNQLNKL